ncbi:MAG: 2-oxoglutarate and iron-dependent oxygenase domain-containing protein [Microthrixaceae bacterium]
MRDVPRIDLDDSEDRLVDALDDACSGAGCFVVDGSPVPLASLSRLLSESATFFALPEPEKAAVAMQHSGAAWRGWFPVGGELTSGAADHKEGLYFGTDDETVADDVVVGDGRGAARATVPPMHGRNLYPAVPASMASTVPSVLAGLSGLGRSLVDFLDRGLGVSGRLLALVEDPLVLLRVFHYPARERARTGGPDGAFGVGEHTDYGLLTMLYTDGPGLQVYAGGRWVDVDPGAGLFCNIGDMLERATGGRYRATRHRVLTTSNGKRSIACFFDPGWYARVPNLLGDAVAGRPAGAADAAGTRWDGVDPHLFDGPYGSYVWSKVSKVFPDLAASGSAAIPASAPGDGVASAGGR